MSVRGAPLALALAVTCAVAPVKGQQLEQIHVEGIQPHSLFGESVGIDGSDMIVGARWDDERGSNAGAAYIFSRATGDLWEQIVKLRANDGRNSDYFGSDVDISGDWAVVGASGFNRRQGAVYLFQRAGNTWQQRAKLIPSGNSARSVFGSAVAIDGSFLAVGAPDHFKGGTVRSGAVYVYVRNSGNWSQQAFIQPGDAGSVDYVGTSVSLSGDLLAIGAPGDGQLRGSVYVFRRSGSNWVQQQKLQPNGGSVGDGFGTSLSMDPNWLVVGAPHDDESVSNQGTVHIYRRTGNNFVFETKVSAADYRVSQMFGFSISVAGSNILIGAPGDRRGAGSVYRFERDGSGRWRQQVKLVPEQMNRRSAFGRTVEIGADDLVIGATGETGALLQSGAVYSLGGGGILRQGFQSIEVSFPTLSEPDLSFADADGDGDLDLTTYGLADGEPRILLYTNEGEDVFLESKLTFEAPHNGFVGWSDIDNNGEMDLVVTGDFSGTFRTDVYLNDGGSAFSRVNLGIPGLSKAHLAWADYDSDGDQDVLIAGTDATGTPKLLLLEHKQGHVFQPVDAGLPTLDAANFDWGDFDRDGHPDILLSGVENGRPVALVHRNRQGDFRQRDFELDGIAGTAHWVDFTSDGYLDVFLCGTAENDDVRAVLLRNDEASGFTEIGATLPSLQSCSGSWGDYDNDGDDDLVLSGTEFGNRVTDVFENVGGEGFDESRFKLSRVSGGAVAWVDFDRDGRLDLAVAGQSEDGHLFELYRNSVGFGRNQPPDVPQNLRAQFNGNNVELRWGKAEDDRSAPDALTYNLRVGSTPGGIDVLAPNTTRNGQRTLSKGGNVGHSLQFTLSGLTDGIYYWSVQAVDQAFAASEFGPEGSFIVGQSAQHFNDINSGIAGVRGGESQWVDFEQTGFLDVLLTGVNDRGPFTRMYRYNQKSGRFQETEVDLPAISESAAAFGDYDNDQDMDLAVIGETDDGLIARVYRNDGANKVTDISAPLVPVSDGDVEWGDLDNDGDLDLVLTGKNEGTRVSTVFTNKRHDQFESTSVPFVGLSNGSIDIGDFDGDQDNDVLLTGFDGTTPRSILYRNDGFPRFTQVGVSLVGVQHGQGSFEDYDGDGDLDILISGRGLDGPVTNLYENRGSENFVAVNTTLPPLEHSSISWGDFDNNGKMDVLLSGSMGASNLTSVHRYMGRKDGFQILHIVDLPATRDGGTAVGDYDRDGRLDMLVTGEGGFFPTSRVIRNEMQEWKNTPPSPPTGLDYRIEGNKLYLFWQASQDAETPSLALTYDLRVSTTHGGSDIMAPNSRPNGSRLSVTRGNVGHNRRWTIVDPPKGRLTVSVHAVDGGYLASQSSQKLTLEIGEDQSSFMTSESVFQGVSYGSATWVDLDEDGDEDISVIGGPIPEEFAAHYLNDGTGLFTEVDDVAVPALAHATASWGDYDGDGDQDLYVSGETEFGLSAYILRNDSGLTFIDIEAPLDLVQSAAASWADYDGDGDPDLIVSGLGELGPETAVYRNAGGDEFEKTDVILPAVFKASHDWADYDEDGDVDLLLTGSDGTFPTTRVLENLGDGRFADTGISLTDVFDGTGDWVDLDGDADLDILVTGHAFEGVVAKMFINAGGGRFFEVASPLPGVRISSTSWGDFDNDGDLDLAIAGWDGLARLTKVFANTGNGTYAEMFTNMTGVSVGSVDWADADGDGDLDLLVAGASDEAPVTNVYLFDQSLGSGKGDASKLATSAEAASGSGELPLPENGFLFKPSYPNPFANRARVHFAVGKTQPVRVSLYNILGQLVNRPFDTQVSANVMMTVNVDAAGLSSGAYFLRIEGSTFADTQTVIVNK